MDFICNLTSVASLRTCLADLPSTYEKAYEKTFERVLGQPDSIVNLAKRVLNWVVHAKRPLTMLELQHAIAIKLSSKSIDPESLESSKLILASCLGMISLSKVDGRVSIIHSTARQFLVTNEQELSDMPQLNISCICLKYLTFDELSSGSCESATSLRQRLARMPFLDYCARAWGHHVRQFQEVLWDELVTVLCSPPLCASAWQVLHYRRLEDEEASEEVFSLQCRNPHGLHVAAFWGFAGFITRSSWKLHETNFSPVDSHGWTPLHWAASLGNEESANGLLNHGVNINASDANSWTPLTFAVVKGHFNVVKLLLSRGADRNTQDTLKLSPERWASICSHDDILQLLRETGEPPVTDKAKIWRQQEKITWKVSMERLETSMNPGELDGALSQCERKVEERGTLEQKPIETNNPPEIWGTMVKMDYYHWGGDQSRVGVSISLRKRILELAILQEKLSIIKLVVQNDTRIGKDLPRGTVGRLGRTCLHTAAYGTSPSIAAFLLQSGADGSIRDEMGRIPLHLAAAYGSLEVVQVMIEAPNVDVNARDEMGRTPIHWCCALGGWKQREKRSEENIKICRLLLSKGASLSAVDDNGHTALHYAIVLRDEEVIRLCLDHGLQLGHKNKKGESPLDIFTNDTYYDSLGHSYGNVWDRPYWVQKYIWWPSKEQTMSALHVVEPYISSEMEIAPEVKKLLHEAREYSLINKS
ncbi:1-alkyl-2-acetylglycerophosphocholine esterase [Ilyonectria robusta]